MNTYARFFLTIMILIMIAPATAQISDPVNGRPGGASHIKSIAEEIAKKGGKSRLQIIESMYGSDIDPSQENISTLTTVITSASPSEEKIVAARILGTLYRTTNSAATNEAIRSQLRPLSQASDKQVAAAAILQYTRLGYFQDTESLLDYNFDRGVLSKNDLYSELAHVLPFAPHAEQARIARRIGASKNAYATDILAANLKSKNLRGRLDKSSKQAILSNLLENPPPFSTVVGDFSLTEAVAYADWLDAVATLTGEVSNRSYDETVLGHIGGEFVNPKKAISFLISPEGKSAAARIGSGKLSMAFKRISDYATMLPAPKSSAAFEYANLALSLKSSVR